MKDGLYRVVTEYLCAGFIIKGDKVIACAPILKKKIKYWKAIAKYICPLIFCWPFYGWWEFEMDMFMFCTHRWLA